jgi:hypothetical protein
MALPEIYTAERQKIVKFLPFIVRKHDDANPSGTAAGFLKDPDGLKSRQKR